MKIKSKCYAILKYSLCRKLNLNSHLKDENPLKQSLSEVSLDSIILWSHLPLFQACYFNKKLSEDFDPHIAFNAAEKEKDNKKVSRWSYSFKCIETSYYSMKICFDNALSIKLNSNYCTVSSICAYGWMIWCIIGFYFFRSCRLRFYYMKLFNRHINSYNCAIYIKLLETSNQNNFSRKEFFTWSLRWRWQRSCFFQL